jgi:predicted acylesterase/phospholipase RssA
MKSYILLSVYTVVSAISEDKCYGLALASGKNFGPYQAGAIQAMLEQGSWDAVSGVTEGALNAYILSLYDKKERLAAQDHLHKFWTYLGSQSVY